MDWSELVRVDWSAFVNRFSDDIHDSSKGFVAYGHHDGALCVANWLSSDKSLSRVQGDGSHVVAAQMLSNFKNEAVTAVLYLKCVENRREFTLKLYIDNGSDDLRNLSGSRKSSRECP